MQKPIKRINNFAQNDCRKCELRAGCSLAAADWQQARKDYPCFYPVNGLVKEVAIEEAGEREQQNQKTIILSLVLLHVESIAIIILTTLLLLEK